MKRLIILLVAFISIVTPICISAAILPVKAVVRITLSQPPSQDNFEGYMVFLDYESNGILVKFTFHKKRKLVYEAVVDASVPEELAKLERMCEENNRDYWDHMRFENRRGIAPLFIKHFLFELTYNSKTLGCINDITVIDWDIDRAMTSRYSKIDLNAYARFSRLDWVKDAVKEITGKEYEYDANSCPAFLAAVRDIGKCGTNGFSFYDLNAKYGGGAEALCSEFVSWYYHDEGVPFGKSIFRDIRSHEVLIDLFAYEERMYEYNNKTQRFEHSVSGEVYIPQPGDYLRRENQGHSMILAGWNEETKIAAVINGPWPVTIRKVEVQKDEDSSDKEYQIGRVNELVILSSGETDQ